MFLNRLIAVLTSLRLTVLCLCAAMVLVFFGTLAQVKIGLWEAQAHYFQSFFVMWSPEGANWKIPVWPGGYLLGWVLLINLLAAHAKRFQLSRKKIGIFLTHAGLILLLLGQFMTELHQVESNMRLEEGETKNYSESTRLVELAVVDITHPDYDEVVSFPGTQLGHGTELTSPQLPFALRIQKFFPNSLPTLRPAENQGLPIATHGVGTRLNFQELPITAKMDDINVPAAHVEVVTDAGVQSSWLLSSWLGIEPLKREIRDQLGSQLGGLLDQPHRFSVGDRTYELALRPVRYYKTHSLHLIKFTHERYRGTSVAKNFSSQVRLRHPESGEDREVLIFMNNPLRYAGKTYYQGSYDPRNEAVTILHVVENPAWLAPYVACTIIGVGLTVQFMMHLVGFARKTRRGGPGGNRTAPSAAAASPPRPKQSETTAAAGAALAHRRSA
jgi:hypothetical protein